MFKWATVVGVLVKKIRMMVKVMRMMILSLDDDDGEQPCWPRIRGFGSVPWSPPKNNHHSQFTLYGWKPGFTDQYTM